MVATDKNDPCTCGSTKKYKHCCQRRDQKQEAKSDQNSAMVQTWLQLGMQSMMRERWQQAKTFYDQVLQANPKQPDALQWLGVVSHKLGYSMRALELIHEALVISPRNAFYYSTLGNVLKDIYEYEQAVESYRKALAIKPDQADVHNNLGVVQYLQGNLKESVESYQRALILVPRYAEALNNMGTVFEAQGNQEAALDAYRHVLDFSPNCERSYFNIGKVLHEKKPEAAIPYFQTAVALKPDFYEANLALAKLLHLQGEIAQAQAAYARCYAIKASPGIKVLSALMLPPVMGTLNEVLAVRSRFESNLAQLTASNIAFDDPLNEYCDTNFHLAYHGLNDKELQVKLANFYAQACPSLMFVAPHCAHSNSLGVNKRIGVLSKFITNHSVALSFSGIISALAAAEGFDVALISTVDSGQASIFETYPNFDGQYMQITGDLGKARDQIAALKLDVLVYLDIGMEAFSYFLAFSRLAPVQCVMGGHPVTTGIPTIDYYLSAELSELEYAQEHYSEKLVVLPFGAFYFERPVLPAAHKTRLDLNLPETGNIYACPMTLHKLHPDFDEVIERILQLDSTGHVVLFADRKFSSWQKQLESRFTLTISVDVLSRILFVPWVSDKQDFMQVLSASAVVLDPFHFGIGTTAIPLCLVGTPFVTKPSEFLRGRAGLYFCNLMDIMECVVQDTEGYAKKAVSIATNPLERERIKRLMLTNNHALFQNDRSIRDVISFLTDVAAPN